MKFSQILKALEIDKKIREDFEVTGVSADSRTVEKGNIFVAIEGYKQDGFSFIKEAVERGAGVIIFEGRERIADGLDAETLTVESSRKTLSLIAPLIYKISYNLSVVGVTGTNGKTTTTYLAEHIFKNQNLEPGVLGTVNYRYKNKIFEASNTTPEPVRLCRILNEMDAEEIKLALLEVSSHSLSQFRVDGIKFKHAIFTNLSGEHLDFHKSMEEYFLAKSRLFTDLKPAGFSIINIDDKFGYRLKNIARSKVLTYGLSENADVHAENILLKTEGISFDLRIANKRIPVKSKLIGRHNVYNILGVCALGFVEGLDLNLLARDVFSFGGTPGRLQRIDCGQPYYVYVDYAHTPQALESALSSLRETMQRRIITVFGCGGNRDRQKRPLMGEIAERLSDVVILTNDNPRDEKPLSIIQEIQAGIKIKTKAQVEMDREAAIKKALCLAREGDCVLIAGKGHENYQIIGDKKNEFNDEKTVEIFLKA